MKELVSMWKNTRMIVLTAICAAAYVAVLLPFKGFVLIPGLTEVRPGIAIPLVFSFLFGPAAAWGSGFGNIIGDALGGMLGPASLFGFLGNFLFGYLPYTLWRAFKGSASPVKSGVGGWILVCCIIVIDCLMIGSVIGLGADLLTIGPFAALGNIIAINNLLACLVLSSLLLSLLYTRISAWGLTYTEILDDESGGGSKRRFLGAVLIIVGSLLAFILGNAISIGVLDVSIGEAGFASQNMGSLSLVTGMAPGMLLLGIGVILQ